MVVVAVFHRHLALRVGAQVGHLPSLAPDVGKHLHYAVGKRERYRHELRGLVGGIAEHHALVAGTLVVLFLALNALVYVAALLVDGCEHAARVAVELVFGLGVANAVDGLAGYRLQVDVLRGAHLAHNHHLAGCHHRLDGCVGVFVVGQKLVEQCVADLVGHLVGMAFRY